MVYTAFKIQYKLHLLPKGEHILIIIINIIFIIIIKYNYTYSHYLK